MHPLLFSSLIWTGVWSQQAGGEPGRQTAGTTRRFLSCFVVSPPRPARPAAPRRPFRSRRPRQGVTQRVQGSARCGERLPLPAESVLSNGHVAVDSAAVGRWVWRPQPGGLSTAEAASCSSGGCWSLDTVQAAPCRPDVSGEPTSWQGAPGVSESTNPTPGAHRWPFPEVLPPDSWLQGWDFSMTSEGHVHIPAESFPASGDCVLRSAVHVICRGESLGPSTPWPAGSRRASSSVEGLAGEQGTSSLPGPSREASFHLLTCSLVSGQVSAWALCLVSETGKKLAAEL